MGTNIELYEALRGTVGEDAARMIADVVPPARDLATRLDVERLATLFAEHRRDTDVGFERVHGELAELRGVMAAGFEAVKGQVEAVKGEVAASRVSTVRWMLAFFLSLWLAILAAAVPLVLRLLE